VAFARAGSHFSRDFEDLVGFLATTADNETISRPVRIDWESVGRILEPVMADGLDPARLDDLFEIGIDEVSWRRRHRYVTLVSNHRKNQVVWGTEGRDAASLDAYFSELGTTRSGAICAVSMDMSAGYAKSVSKPGHARRAVICYDPFHVVQLGTKATPYGASTGRRRASSTPGHARAWKPARSGTLSPSQLMPSADDQR